MDIDAEKLLFSIEGRSPLYNSKDKDHANRTTTEKLWKEVADEMNCQVSECKNKWISLRNSYSRYLREEKTKPSGTCGKPKKKWYLADAMSFLRDYINQNRSVKGNLDDIKKYEIADEIDEIDPLTASNESIASNTSTPRNSPVPCKRNRPTLVSEMVAGPMIEFLQSRTKQRTQDNANALFFQSLLADFEKLSSTRQRTFKMLMLQKMNELQVEEENDALNSLVVQQPEHPYISYTHFET